jgi:multiple sugar transport system substrate-binding protein
MLRSTIGGTGLAISAHTKNKNAALVFVEMVLSGECQSTFYVEHGGQPGHRAAWTDKKANELTNNFFTNVLPAMERGFIRPRYNGYLHFQDQAGKPIQEYLLNGGNPKEVLQEINVLYRQSMVSSKSSVLL